MPDFMKRLLFILLLSMAVPGTVLAVNMPLTDVHGNQSKPQ